MEKSTKNKVNPYRSFSLLLLISGIFFIPFNSYEGLSFLGEFSNESSFIFFSLAFVVEVFLVLYRGKIKIPVKNPVFIILILTIIWILLSFIFNIYDIQDYYLKQTSGNNRFIRQYVALLISSLFFLLTYYNIFSRFSISKIFEIIRKVFLYSFIVVSIYTIIEASIIYLSFNSLEPVIRIFDYFPFNESYLDFKNKRLSSVSYAPPVFGMYLMTIAGWMFSYLITHKGLLKFIPSILIIVFVFLSDSRSALVIILLQFLAFLLFFIKKRRYQVKVIKITTLAILITLPILILRGDTIINFISNKIESFNITESKHSVSNKSRLGMIYTSGLIFIENPIKGVGFGQQAYEAEPLYPDWAKKNNWEFEQRFLNDDYLPFPPSFNLYSRLLAETGIIGFLLFSCLLFLTVYICYRKMYLDKNNSVLYLILFVSFIGYSFNWLQVDTFRVFGFWINLALLLYLTKNTTFKI